MKQLGILDSAFINLEQPNTPQHVGGIAFYDPSTAPGGFVRFKQVIANFEQRLLRMPLFRTRLVEVPGGIDKPYWVLDANFDVEADDRYAIADARSQVRRREEKFATLHLNWMIGDVDVRWFSGMLDSKIKIDQDRDQTDIPSVLLFQDGHYGDDLDSNQHELRVSGNAFDIWDWTAGAYYQEAFAQTDVDTLANRPQDGGVFNIIIVGTPFNSAWSVISFNTFFMIYLR